MALAFGGSPTQLFYLVPLLYSPTPALVSTSPHPSFLSPRLRRSIFSFGQLFSRVFGHSSLIFWGAGFWPGGTGALVVAGCPPGAGGNFGAPPIFLFRLFLLARCAALPYPTLLLLPLPTVTPPFPRCHGAARSALCALASLAVAVCVLCRRGFFFFLAQSASCGAVRRKGGLLVAFVAFSGQRRGPAASSPLVGEAVRSVLASGRGVAVGCAAGVDSAAVAAAVAAGAAARLAVFCAFGPSGLGALPGSSASPASFLPVVAAGGSVSWWAGGGPGVVGSGRGVPPPTARLVGRSLACVRFATRSGFGCGLVAFVAGPPPSPFAPARPGGWPSCGSGSWASAGAAALLGLPVVLFPVGVAGPLPALPGAPGAWVPAAASGLWSAAFLWRRS